MHASKVATGVLAGRLGDICGSAQVTESEKIKASYGFPAAHAPRVLVRPDSARQIREIVLYAIASGSTLIPVGSGTAIGQVLSTTPADIGLCLSRLDRIVEFEADNLSVCCQAGVLYKEINDLAGKNNLMVPVYADFEHATAGGLAASDFSGWKRYRYGSMTDALLGLRFISPRGELIATGGKTVKNVSGYDFTRLLGGSWGRLGILVELTLKLLPKPPQMLIANTSFPTVAEALAEGLRLLRCGRLASCNVQNDRESGTTLTLAIDGSPQYIASHSARLQLDTSWEVSGDADHEEDMEKNLLLRRRLIKRNGYHTAVVDKRSIAETSAILAFLENEQCPFDFDLSAGVLEFASAHGTPDFTTGWRRCTDSIRGLYHNVEEPLQPSPVLARLLPTLDPHNIMFTDHRYAGRQTRV